MSILFSENYLKYVLFMGTNIARISDVYINSSIYLQYTCVQLIYRLNYIMIMFYAVISEEVKITSLVNSIQGIKACVVFSQLKLKSDKWMSIWQWLSYSIWIHNIHMCLWYKNFNVKYSRLTDNFSYPFSGIGCTYDFFLRDYNLWTLLCNWNR